MRRNINDVQKPTDAVTNQLFLKAIRPADTLHLTRTRNSANWNVGHASVLRAEMKDASGPLQVCVGYTGGAEPVIHVMNLCF